MSILTNPFFASRHAAKRNVGNPRTSESWWGLGQSPNVALYVFYSFSSLCGAGMRSRQVSFAQT